MRMTFREIAIYADGVNEREGEQWKDQVRIAWLTARLSRIPLPVKQGQRDQFPKMEDLLPKPAVHRSVSRKQRAKENAARFLRFADKYNRKLNKAKKKK